MLLTLDWDKVSSIWQWKPIDIPLHDRAMWLSACLTLEALTAMTWQACES